MDIRKVKKLIELLEESGIDELEIHEGEESVRISRYTQKQPAAAMPYPAYAPMPPAQQAAPEVATTSANHPQSPQPEAAAIHRSSGKITHGRNILYRTITKFPQLC